MSIFPPVTKEHLAEVRIFEGMDDETLDDVARRCIAIGAHPGARLVDQGESGFDFYMIHSGRGRRGRGRRRAGRHPRSRRRVRRDGAARQQEADRRRGGLTQMSLITMMVWDFRQAMEDHPDIGHRLRALAEERLSG